MKWSKVFEKALKQAAYGASGAVTGIISAKPEVQAREIGTAAAAGAALGFFGAVQNALKHWNTGK